MSVAAPSDPVLHLARIEALVINLSGRSSERDEGDPCERLSLPGAAAPGSGKRILVVDDEPGVRAVLDRFLTRCGHRVTLAEDGEVALEWIKEATEPYDLILSDLRMPGVDGQNLLRRLKLMRPEYADRVVFVTGDVTAPEVRAPHGEAAIPVVQKPFGLDQIRRVVAQRTDT